MAWGVPCRAASFEPLTAASTACLATPASALSSRTPQSTSGSRSRIYAPERAPGHRFDIGVAAGTPELYEAFPRARFHLIDPLPASVPHMRRWATRLDASIMDCALGERAGQAILETREDLGGSTLFKEVGRHVLRPTVAVRVRRFDELFGLANLSGTTLVKIDVQGAELDVLRGMGELIDYVDLFIVEVSLRVAWMTRRTWMTSSGTSPNMGSSSTTYAASSGDHWTTHWHSSTSCSARARVHWWLPVDGPELRPHRRSSNPRSYGGSMSFLSARRAFSPRYIVCGELRAREVKLSQSRLRGEDANAGD